MDRRRLLATATATAGAVSIAATAVIRARGLAEGPEQAAPWLLAEPLALAVLVGAVVRWASPRTAALSGSLAALGSGLWVHRYLSSGSALESIAATATWLIPSLALGAIGWYLRWAAAERVRAIALAAAEQRSRLALDLHDYVAHDISEIVARAQAGAAVLPIDDPRVTELLEEITAAGLRALDSMDRTVHALAADQDLTHADRGGVEQIDELVQRFAAAGNVSAVVENRLTERIDARISAEVHRAVVEALTNVRRHALRVTEVVVALSAAEGRLIVSIADDGESRSVTGPSVRAGLGLAAMADRVQRLGGSVDAGPRRPRGWSVRLSLPLPAAGLGEGA